MEWRPVISDEDRTSLISWYACHGRHYLPWRKSPTPWKILMAETLLRRTRAQQVAFIFEDLIRDFSFPSQVLSLPDHWETATRSLGLPARSDLFRRMCSSIVNRYGGEVPCDTIDLIALPGVGHYGASAVRCFGFGSPDILVDTNTIRLTSRISGSRIDNRSHRNRETRDQVARIGETLEGSGSRHNYALLDLAGIVCTIKSPVCDECPVRNSCWYGSNCHVG